MKLSENFSLIEFTKSDTAIRLGIDNRPDPRQTANLMLLCHEVLEPVRKHFGKPIKITSGFRSVALNKAIGGSQTSDHSKGFACDFVIQGVDNKEIAKWIQDNLQYKELILEFYGTDNSWIHISYDESNLEKETLTANKVNGKTVYTKAKF